MTSPESTQIVAQRNLRFWPDQHPELQSVIMDYADVMTNDPRTEREVIIKGASVAGYYPPEFTSILGKIKPQFVDLSYGYSPVDDHYSPFAEVHDFSMRLHGDTRTGEVVDIAPSHGAFRKQHTDSNPFSPTQSENMNILEPAELKNLLVALLRYDMVEPGEILDDPLESLLTAARRAGNALVGSSVQASELDTAVGMSQDLGTIGSHVLISKRTWRQYDGEPMQKNVYTVEVSDTTGLSPVPGVSVPVTRTLHYRFSESPLTDGRNPYAHVSVSVPDMGSKNREFAERWLASQLEDTEQRYLRLTKMPVGHLLSAVRAFEDATPSAEDVA